MISSLLVYYVSLLIQRLILATAWIYPRIINRWLRLSSELPSPIINLIFLFINIHQISPILLFLPAAASLPNTATMHWCKHNPRQATKSNQTTSSNKYNSKLSPKFMNLITIWAWLALRVEATLVWSTLRLCETVFIRLLV